MIEPTFFSFGNEFEVQCFSVLTVCTASPTPSGAIVAGQTSRRQIDGLPAGAGILTAVCPIGNPAGRVDVGCVVEEVNGQFRQSVDPGAAQRKCQIRRRGRIHKSQRPHVVGTNLGVEPKNVVLVVRLEKEGRHITINTIGTALDSSPTPPDSCHGLAVWWPPDENIVIVEGRGELSYRRHTEGLICQKSLTISGVQTPLLLTNLLGRRSAKV